MIHSTCTQRVLTTLTEKGLKYEVRPVDIMNGEHKVKKEGKNTELAHDCICRQAQKYLEEMQPFGVIPVLIDADGFKIYGQ